MEEIGQKQKAKQCVPSESSGAYFVPSFVPFEVTGFPIPAPASHPHSWQAKHLQWLQGTPLRTKWRSWLLLAKSTEVGCAHRTRVLAQNCDCREWGAKAPTESARHQDVNGWHLSQSFRDMLPAPCWKFPRGSFTSDSRCVTLICLLSPCASEIRGSSVTVPLPYSHSESHVPRPRAIPTAVPCLGHRHFWLGFRHLVTFLQRIHTKEIQCVSSECGYHYCELLIRP